MIQNGFAVWPVHVTLAGWMLHPIQTQWSLILLATIVIIGAKLRSKQAYWLGETFATNPQFKTAYQKL